MTAKPTDPLVDVLRPLAEQAVAVLGRDDVFVVEVDVRGTVNQRVVTVAVDGDQGVDAEVLAAISRALSALLDTADPIDGAYRLDVASPGATRPLALPRQYPRHVGRPFKVKYHDGSAYQTVTGRLAAADSVGITLERGPDDPLSIPFDQIREAKVQLPW